MNRSTDVLRCLARLTLGRFRQPAYQIPQGIQCVVITDKQFAIRHVNGQVDGPIGESWLDRLHRESVPLEKAYLARWSNSAQAGSAAMQMMNSAGASHWRSVVRQADRNPTFQSWLEFGEELYGRYTSYALLAGILIFELGEDHQSIKFFLDILELLTHGLFPCGIREGGEFIVLSSMPSTHD